MRSPPKEKFTKLREKYSLLVRFAIALISFCLTIVGVTFGVTLLNASSWFLVIGGIHILVASFVQLYYLGKPFVEELLEKIHK